MKRGEIWIVSARGPIAKPRPAVILQSDLYAETSTVTICGFTSDATVALITRPVVEPSSLNGLSVVSRALIDRLTTTDRVELAARIGELEPADLEKIQRGLLVFLGFA